jgi:hypothetical protein
VYNWADPAPLPLRFLLVTPTARDQAQYLNVTNRREDFDMSTRTRLLAASLALTLAGGLLVAVATVPVVADSTTIDFEGFVPGSPDGQDGWNADGSAGSGCATYDHQIVVNGGGAPVSFGTTSLRMSNAVTSGCFGDQTYSKSLTDEAGESLAGNNGMSGGSRQAHFEAQWDFASTVPGAEQPGLSVVASPDRGDGARMSWIQMTDTPGGLAVNFFDFRDKHPVGTIGNPSDGCSALDNFFSTNIANGLDRTTAHTIGVTMDFLEGPRNDVVRVWVDGALVHTDTSWEDYFRYCEGNPTRTVDSILFRTGGAPVPATAGNGFLIDNLSLNSGPTTSAVSEGEWTLVPAQPVSSTTTTTSETLSQADVRPPIRADGTSSFPKQRGVVPVQFNLETATHTTVTTTTVVGPVAFNSIGSDIDPDNDYAFLRFVPDTPMAFADLNTLVADYSFLQGDCGGGSLRWQVRLDVANDGDPSNDANIFVYFGDVPNFTDCTGAGNNSGGNLIGSSDARFDASQLGGPTYGTYADMLALYGGTRVLRTSLVVDGGWLADQMVDLTGASSDGNTWTPLPVGTTTTVDSDTTTPFAKTCTLPQAALRWSKNNPLPAAAVNGAESIQPGNPGLYYRTVDCKYIYNLDVSSLDPNLSTRAGTYRVWVNLGGGNIASPATFILR